MEVLVILLFIILLFVILSFKKTVNQNVEKLSRDIERLREELAKKPVQQTLSDAKSATTILPVPGIPKPKDYWETSFKPIDEPAKEDKPDTELALEKAATPLNIEWKILTFLFPGMLQLIFSTAFKAEGYDRKAKDLTRWTLLGFGFYTLLLIAAFML